MMGWSVMFCAIRSSAASPSSTVTSHRSSQRSSTAPWVTPTTTNGRLARASTTASPGSANPSCRSTRTAPVRSAGISLRSSASSASALRGSRIARRYPADVDDLRVERWASSGAMALTGWPDRTARTAGGPGGRDRSARQAVPGTGCTRAPGRAGRVDGVVATGRHELRGKLPVAPLRGRVHGRLAAPRRGHGDGPRLARTRDGAHLRPRRVVHGGGDDSPTPIRTSSSSGPGCSGYRSPASAKRPDPKARGPGTRGTTRRSTATTRHDGPCRDRSLGPLGGPAVRRSPGPGRRHRGEGRVDATTRRSAPRHTRVLRPPQRAEAIRRPRPAEPSGHPGPPSAGPKSRHRDRGQPPPRPGTVRPRTPATSSPPTAVLRSGSPSPATAATARAPTASRSATTLRPPAVSSRGPTTVRSSVVDAVADPLTGLTAAGACVDALRSGGRWLLDVSMAAVSADLAGPTLPTHPGLVVAAPHARPVTARAPELGADTALVLAELGIEA